MDLIDKNIDNAISTDSAKIGDDALKENAVFAAKTGLEIRVTRTYDGVGLSGKRQCEWCLDRCGTNMTLQEAYEIGAFQRHEGCECVIEYTSAKGERTTQRGKGGRGSWTPDDNAVAERIRQANYASLDGCEKAMLECVESKVRYLDVKQLPEKLSSSDIIKKISGGDKSGGSCQSLAFAYAGNILGYDVRDFRGGTSRSIFSRSDILREIAKTHGVAGFITKDYNGFASAKAALRYVERSKEYIFATGKHTAIVRKREPKGIEYLELQDPLFAGFLNLDTKALSGRFDVTKQRSQYGQKFEQESVLIDIESLRGNDSFREMLGFINTTAEGEKKGDSGRAR